MGRNGFGVLGAASQGTSSGFRTYCVGFRVLVLASLQYIVCQELRGGGYLFIPCESETFVLMFVGGQPAIISIVTGYLVYSLNY